jgi:thioredoxin-like negative regulator of GroEL
MIKISNKDSLDAELKKNSHVLALFYSSWCPYCVRFVPIFNQQTANMPNGSVVHVLLDDYDDPMWDDFSIGAVPTIILFKDGIVSKRLDGKFGSGLNEKQLKVWLKESGLA